MLNVHWGSVVLTALIGSASILAAMYVLLPALGLPRLDFAAVTGGWVGATGRYAKAVGVAVFLIGSTVWAFLYAGFWPRHSVTGGVAFALIPFALAAFAVLPSLNQYRIMVNPMPGFFWFKVGGRNAMIANLVEHVIFGLCLGLFYR